MAQLNTAIKLWEVPHTGHSNAIDTSPCELEKNLTQGSALIRAPDESRSRDVKWIFFLDQRSTFGKSGMPEISFFIDEHDLRVLLDRLNSEPDIAFIVPNGPVPNSQAQQPRSSGLRVQIQGSEPHRESAIPSLGKRFEH